MAYCGRCGADIEWYDENGHYYCHTTKECDSNVKNQKIIGAVIILLIAALICCYKLC